MGARYWRAGCFGLWYVVLCGTSLLLILAFVSSGNSSRMTYGAYLLPRLLHWKLMLVRRGLAWKVK
jgi:hypothetical protein